MVQRFTPGWEADLFQMSSVRAGARIEIKIEIKRQLYSFLHLFFGRAASVAKLDVFFHRHSL